MWVQKYHSPEITRVTDDIRERDEATINGLTMTYWHPEKTSAGFGEKVRSLPEVALPKPSRSNVLSDEKSL